MNCTLFSQNQKERMSSLINTKMLRQGIAYGCPLLIITNKARPAERPLAPPGPFTGLVTVPFILISYVCNLQLKPFTWTKSSLSKTKYFCRDKNMCRTKIISMAKKLINSWEGLFSLGQDLSPQQKYSWSILNYFIFFPVLLPVKKTLGPRIKSYFSC